MKIIFKLMKNSKSFVKNIQNAFLMKPLIQNHIIQVKWGLKILNKFPLSSMILTKSLELTILKNLHKSFDLKSETLILIQQFPQDQKKRILSSINFDPISAS